jgi:hypothetical protein
MIVEFDIDDMEVDAFVATRLKEILGGLKNDDCKVPYFSYDARTEKKLKKKLKKAIEITIAWYSVGGQVEELLK